MLKILLNEEIHTAGLAKKLGISSAAATKHIKILEGAGLIERRELGRMHLLKAKPEKIFDHIDEMFEPTSINVEEGASVLDALRKVTGISVNQVGDNEYLLAVDGQKGYFVYEVNGELVDVPMNQFKLHEDKKISLKELVPITRKNLDIKVK